ncbi:MAG: cell envelope integrity protein TolA [bacterium]|nr:cell envelope integrity protein TolA [bacterium]
MDPSSKITKYVLYSLLFHAVVLAAFLILAAYAPIRKIPETKITMVRLTPKLGTPTGSPTAPPGIPEPPKEKPPEPKPETKAPEEKAPPPPKVTEKPKPKPKPKPTEKKPTSKVKVRTQKVKKPDEAELANALRGIDQELEKREQEMKAPAAGTPGATTTGVPALGTPTGSVQARDPGFAQYQSKVRSKIIRNWVKTHTGGESRRLSARIRVRINASGAVISKTFSKRSGDPAFDASAMRAVERASPLPAPPPGVKAEALREGFVVHFRARFAGS